MGMIDNGFSNDLTTIIARQHSTHISRIILYIEPDGLDASQLSSIIESLGRLDCVLVCRRRFVVDQLRVALGRNSSIIFQEDIFDAASLEEIDEVAYQLIEGWYLQPLMAEILTLRGFNIGPHFEQMLGHIVPFVFKDARLLLELRKRYGSGHLIIIPASIERADHWSAIASQLGAANIGPGQIDVIGPEECPGQSSLDRPSVIKRLIRHMKLRLFSSIARPLLLRRLRSSTKKRRVIMMRRGASGIGFSSHQLKGLDRFQVVEFDEYHEISSVGELHTMISAPQPYYAFNIHGSKSHDVEKSAQQVHSKWINVWSDHGFRRMFDAFGLELWPVLQPIWDSKILGHLETEFRLVHSIDRGLEKINPAAIVVRSDISSFMRSLCLVAQQKGIPTLLIQHGIRAELRGQESIYASNLAMWGDAHLDRQAAAAKSSEGLTVTGAPNHDRFVSQRARPRGLVKSQVCESLNFDPEQKIVMLGMRTNTPDYWYSAFRFADAEARVFEVVVKAVQQIGSAQLLVKMHPSDRITRVYHEILSQINDGTTKVAIVQNYSLDDALIACDVLITHGSTVALEAMIIGRPVIITNFTARDDLIPYAGEGPAVSVRDPGQLVPALRDILEREETPAVELAKRTRFIERYAYKIDGQSTERVRNLINEIATRGARS